MQKFKGEKYEKNDKSFLYFASDFVFFVTNWLWWTFGYGGGDIYPLNPSGYDDYGGTPAPSINQNDAIAVFKYTIEMINDITIERYYYFYNDQTFQYLLKSNNVTTAEFRGTYTGTINTDPGDSTIPITITMTSCVFDGTLYTREDTIAWASYIGDLNDISTDEAWLDKKNGKIYLNTENQSFEKIK